MPVTGCPSNESLQSLARGELALDDVEPLAQHVEACPACAARVEALRGQDDPAEALRQFGAQPTEPRDAERPRVEALIKNLHDLATAVYHTAGDERAVVPAPATTRAARDLQEMRGVLGPPQAPGELGRLGPYRVLDVLGSGGMGMVFVAEDGVLQRRVALKVMRPRLASEPSAQARFLREARAAAAVRHDHVVTIYNAGVANGVAYLAMELLAGEALEARLERQRVLAVADVVRIGRAIAEGLAAAHELGLIHRDVKPANIWLESQRGASAEAAERVKLLDFGLARVLQEDTTLTSSGVVLGTLGFMAPEQANGEPVDARCDLFSLGVVLYRMATGVMPFKGSGPLEILRSLAVDAPAAPVDLDPRVPAKLSALILSLLARSPGARPATAQAVAAELRGLDRPAREAWFERGLPHGGRRWSGVIGALLLTVGVAAGVLVHQQARVGLVFVETDEPAAEIRIDGKEQIMLTGQDRYRFELQPGQFKLQVGPGQTSTAGDATQFHVAPGDRLTIRIRRRANDRLVIIDR